MLPQGVVVGDGAVGKVCGPPCSSNILMSYSYATRLVCSSPIPQMLSLYVSHHPCQLELRELTLVVIQGEYIPTGMLITRI